MLPFRLRFDALHWFRDLYTNKSFGIDFDAFYFCFVAGICANAKQKENIPTDKTKELVDYFPGRYNSRGNLLISLFLIREFQALGVTLAEKETVHATIGRLVNSYSTNRLSAEGVREFNKYAHAGFDILLDWFDEDRPRTLETFLRTFKDHVEDAFSGETHNLLGV